MPPPPHPVAGRAVLVTGAARGIGAETARRLAARGARVSLVGLEPEELERVAAQCGGDAMWVEADVTDPDSIQAAVDATVDRFGGLDALVANAGIAPFGTVATMDPVAFERVVEVNLLGVWRTVRVALPHLLERRGYLLIVASLAVAAQAPGFSAYAASKAGVEAFANCLRLEVRHRGVDVGVAYYSWIDSDMVRGAYVHPGYTHLRESLKGPIAKTYPVQDAAEATVRGIERRAREVFAPRWLRAVLALRGVLRHFAERDADRFAPEIVRLSEEEVERLGAEEASKPAGPGGEAGAEAARTGS